jgi:hypothetical protein
VFFEIDSAPTDGVVVTDGNREGVEAVNRLAIQVFPRFLNDAEEREEESANAMESTIEPTLAQHGGNEVPGFQMGARFFKVPAKLSRRDDSCGHHFGVAHGALCISVVTQRFEQIVTQAKNDIALFGFQGGGDLHRKFTAKSLWFYDVLLET